MGQAGGEDHKGIEYSDKNGLRKRHLRRWIRSDDKLIAIYLERERERVDEVQSDYVVGIY